MTKTDQPTRALPTNLKELREFAMELNKGKYSNVPAHAIPKPQPFKDSSANELTKSVLYDLIEVRGAAAYRGRCAVAARRRLAVEPTGGIAHDPGRRHFRRLCRAFLPG